MSERPCQGFSLPSGELSSAPQGYQKLPLTAHSRSGSVLATLQTWWGELLQTPAAPCHCRSPSPCSTLHVPCCLKDSGPKYPMRGGKQLPFVSTKQSGLCRSKAITGLVHTCLPCAVRVICVVPWKGGKRAGRGHSKQ